MSKKRGSSTVKIFISHSHRDRHLATELQSVLTQYGAETFLDQDKIQAGDDLSIEIRDGISSCDVLLLLWSASAASSAWVRAEWDMAYDLSKKIIPYVLDGTAFPSTPENLLYLDAGDREHADAGLLRSIFGNDFRPEDTTTLFPGRWQAIVDVLGIGQAIFELELRENGQLEGTGFLSNSGLIGGLADETMRRLLERQIPVYGKWSYDQVTQALTLNTTASILGQEQHDTVRILATGREEGAISGEDLGGRFWKLQRVQEVDLSKWIEEFIEKCTGTPYDAAFTIAYALGGFPRKVAEMEKPGSYRMIIPWAQDIKGEKIYCEPMELKATRGEDYRDDLGQTGCEVTMTWRWRDNRSGPPCVQVVQFCIVDGQWIKLRAKQQ